MSRSQRVAIGLGGISNLRDSWLWRLANSTADKGASAQRRHSVEQISRIRELQQYSRMIAISSRRNAVAGSNRA